MTRTIQLAIATIVVMIWAETFVSSKILLQHGLNPADIFFYRFTIAYIGMILLSHKRLWANSWKHELLFAGTGIFGGSLYFLTENMALKFSTASNVAIIVGTTPIMTALFLALFYKEERMNKRQIIGSGIAFLGLVLVVLNGQFVLHLNPLGDSLALGASISWGLYSLCLKGLSGKYDAKFLTRKVFGYGLLTILPWFAFVVPLNTDNNILQQPAVWGNLIYLATVASLLCFLVWNWLMPRVGVVTATNIVYTQSIFTMIIASIVLDERITLMAIVGTVILISGMYLINKKKLSYRKQIHNQ